MILLKEYEIEDWSKIDDAVEPFSPLMPTEDFKSMTKHSIAVTGIEDGAVMACGGITYTNDTEGVVWVKVSKKCFKQPYRWAKSIRQTFEIMMDSIGNLKISTYVISGFRRGEKLARMIGLHKTGKAEEYNGKQYFKYMTVT